MSETARHNPRYLLIPAAFVLLWGNGFIAAETGLGHADSLTFFGLHYGVVTVLMGIIAVAMRAAASTSEVLAASCGLCVGEKVEPVSVDGRIDSNSQTALIGAAMRGFELFLAPRWVVEEYLNRGELEIVLAD